VDIFFFGDMVWINKMNIAEDKKNAMTILSTNPCQMFISGKNQWMLTDNASF
jgi:hypothetical protein